jgi:tRNA threonylcarbamoyladenosine biosynthesis protein TsaB
LASGEIVILSVDTTARAGSVAVLRGPVVVAELTGDAAVPHGQRLPLDLERVLAQAGLGIADVSLLAVAAGPGSFTGIRIGIATVQGLAMSRGLRVVPVSTLDALAQAGANATRAVATWIDAHRGEVYGALYGPGGRDTRVPAAAATAETLLAGLGEPLGTGGAVFIGDGAVRYRDVIAAALGERATILPTPPLAGLIGQIAAAEPAGAVGPHALVPIYVRKPDVELARDRRPGS